MTCGPWGCHYDEFARLRVQAPVARFPDQGSGFWSVHRYAGIVAAADWDARLAVDLTGAFHVARAALLSDAASYVNGAVIPVDGSASAVDVGTLPFGPRIDVRPL